MEGVPVLCPAGQSLVQAAVEHQAIPLSVLYDAGFLVKYRLTCQKTSADGITGNGYADVQEAPGNHPGEQLQAVVQFPVMPGGFRRFLCLGTVRKGRAQETGFHGLLQRLAQQDGVPCCHGGFQREFVRQSVPILWPVLGKTDSSGYLTQLLLERKRC